MVGSPQHVYYFSGYFPFWQQHAAFLMFDDGRSLLIHGRPPASPLAVDDLIPFMADFMGTQRQEQPEAIADLLADRLGASARRHIGVDASAVSLRLTQRLADQAVALDPAIWQLRRRKDPDELALMKKAIVCTEAMYRRARQIVSPGIAELDVFAQLHAVAIDIAGEPLTALLGNDFACGVPGGPPRAGRRAAAGELYILDLGPAYRGYFADNSRALSVDRRPTDAQHRAWETVTTVFPIVEKIARPGARCRDLFAAIDSHYRERTGQPFPHHLGHGVGLQPHEYPHLNPNWDDVLMEGEVFTAEPGLYGPHLGGGMRIENQYLVTAVGVENLTPFPMDM